MDILDLIKKDHRNIDTLFFLVESTDDTTKIYDCFNQLYNEINLNVEAKEQIFYPGIRDRSETKQLIDTAQKRQEQVKQLLEEIESLSPSSPEFKPKLRELKQSIQLNIQQEEEVFSQVRESMSEQERSQLGNQFEAIKSKL